MDQYGMTVCPFIWFPDQNQGLSINFKGVLGRIRHDAEDEVDLCGINDFFAAL